MRSSRNRRIADAQLKAREWAKTFDAVEKKFQVERWVLLALWGMESDFGTEKDRWDVFRSLATLAYVKYRHPYFRNELIVAMRIMQDNRYRPRQDGQLLGRRHGPDPVHAVELRRLCDRFFRRRPRRHLEQRAGRACLDGQLSAQVEMESRTALGLRGSRCRTASTTCAAAQVSRNGRRSVCAAPTANRFQLPDRAFSSSRAAPTARASSSRKISMC